MGNWDGSKPNNDGEPCEDCISRADAEALFRNAREELHKSAIRNEQNGHPIKDLPTRDLMLLNAEQMIHLLPSVTPKQRDCENCCDGIQTEKAKLCQRSYLAGAESKQRTGHWIFDEILDKHYYCSECKSMGVDYWDYCPNCGCRMVEPQERNGV